MEERARYSCVDPNKTLNYNEGGVEALDKAKGFMTLDEMKGCGDIRVFFTVTLQMSKWL